MRARNQTNQRHVSSVQICANSDDRMLTARSRLHRNGHQSHGKLHAFMIGRPRRPRHR